MAGGFGGRGDPRQGGGETGSGGALAARWIREVVRDGAGADEHGALGRGDRVGQATPE